MVDGIQVLRHRVSRLDGRPEYADLHGPVDPDIAHFIRVVGAMRSSRVSLLSDEAPVVLAEAADGVIKECDLLRRLFVRIPQVVCGPLDRNAQFWVATGRPEHLPGRHYSLDRAYFIEPSPDGVCLDAKPFGIGLYTSTGTFGSFGMWRSYLELHRSSSLVPLPWCVWRVSVGQAPRVLEVSSAAQWVRFVMSSPLQRGELLFPDWHLAASIWDGVHVSLQAVAATEGIRFAASGQVVAAPYWGVESTLWLRWCFGVAELVEEAAD